MCFACRQLICFIQSTINAPLARMGEIMARIRGRLYVAGRRVNLLLASSGCAPDCTRRPASGSFASMILRRENCSWQIANWRKWLHHAIFGVGQRLSMRPV